MPTNDFQAFATGAGASVIDQADFLAAAWLATGFQAGIADPLQLNKVWRQSSFISSVVAAFIVQETGLDLLDDGNGSTALTKLTSAIQTAMLIASNSDAQAGTNATEAMTPATARLVQQADSFGFCVDQSTGANSYNAYPVGGATTPTNGFRVTVQIAHTNTGASTLNINGGTGHTIKKRSGGSWADVASGDLTAGHFYEFRYDSTNAIWQLMTPVG